MNLFLTGEINKKLCFKINNRLTFQLPSATQEPVNYFLSLVLDYNKKFFYILLLTEYNSLGKSI